MTIWHGIYCNQYLELKEHGKGRAARYNGTLLVTVALLSHFILIFYLLLGLIPGFEPAIEIAFGKIFGGMPGKTIGQILAFPMIALFYLLSRFTLGTKKGFERTILEFDSLPAEQQKRISQIGLIYFFISLGTGILAIFVFGIINGMN